MLRKLSTLVAVFTAVHALWADAAHAQILRASPTVDAVPRVYLISSGERSAALVATPDGVTLDIDNDVLVQTDSDNDGTANIAVIQKDTPTIHAEVWSDSPLHVGDRIMYFEEIGTDDGTGETFYWVSVQEPNYYLFVDLARGTIMVIEFSGVLDLVTRQKPEPTERNQRVIQHHPGSGDHVGVRDDVPMSGGGRARAACAMLDVCFGQGHDEVPDNPESCVAECERVGFCSGESCIELCFSCSSGF